MPFERALAMHSPGLPLSVVLIVILPAVSPRPFALALPPQTLIHISIGIHLLSEPLLQITCPASLHSKFEDLIDPSLLVMPSPSLGWLTRTTCTAALPLSLHDETRLLYG